MQENIGYSSSTSGDGFSANGTSVSVGQNNSLSGRSGTATFTQPESGRSASVSLSQAAGIEGWNYTFSVSPTSLSFEAVGGTKSVSITSYRRQTINGSETGMQENIGYSSSTSGDGFSANGASVSVGQNNSLSGRSGTATFTQPESGRSASVSLSQAAGIEGWNYYFNTPTPTIKKPEPEKYLEIEFSVNSFRVQTINGIETEFKKVIPFSSVYSKEIDYTEVLYYEDKDDSVTYIINSGGDFREGQTGTITCNQTGTGKAFDVTIVITA